jgi:soluble lytic murein transglycosylase-like protein
MNRLKIGLILIIILGVGIYAFQLNRSSNRIKVLAETIEASPTLAPTEMPTPTITPTPTPSSTPTPSPTRGPTPTPSPIPIIIAPPDLEPLFAEFSTKYNVDANLLKKIASCESHFNRGVVSGNEKYMGMFQFEDRLWIHARNEMGENPDANLRFGARESIQTAAWVIAHWGSKAWPVCSK